MKLLAFEMRWLLAITVAILPSGAHERLADGADRVPMRDFYDDLLVRAPLRPMLGLRAAVWLIALSPPFMMRRARTFGGLAAAERAGLLAALAGSDIYLVRELPLLVKTMALMGYGAMPRVQRAAGVEYEPPAPPVWLRKRDTE